MERYTVEGNVSCSNPPVAALAADVTSGNAPLTVNFNASASNIPAGGCGTIASYIFDFGDGNQVTQAAPNATVAHTYTTGGVTYPARVRVVSTKGITSSNNAQQNITVNTVGPPPLQSVVSRMTHGGAVDFDVVLPQPPDARAIECRSGGNYKLVLTFVNNLVSVASAGITTGTGSILNSGLGPNTNQYTVNLTGVTDIQTLTVTLTSAIDSTGANGNIVVSLPVLVGDVNGSARVDSGDVSLVRQQALATVTIDNFRNDLNASNRIDSGDVSIARQNALHSLP